MWLKILMEMGLMQSTKAFRTIILCIVLIAFGCNNPKNRENSLKGNHYFHGKLSDKNIILELNGDSISKYVLEDSIYSKNILSTSSLTQIDENAYTIKLEDSIVELSHIEFDNIHDYNGIYDGYWVDNQPEGEIWKKFVPNYPRSYNLLFYYDATDEQKGSFYTTRYVTMFDKFHFIFVTYGSPKCIYLITKLSDNKLSLFDLNQEVEEEKHLYLTKSQSHDSLFVGTWDRIGDYQSEGNLFEKFRLDEHNVGIILDQKFDNDSILYFANRANNGVFLIIQNELLYTNILEFDLLEDDKNMLKNTEISDYYDIKYSRSFPILDERD